MTTFSFKDFDIKPNLASFPGRKIDVSNVFNLPIVVHDFKVEPSKKKAGTQLLTLDVELNSERRVIFTGSTVLLDMINRVPKSKFPFNTTIVLRDQHLEFT